MSMNKENIDICDIVEHTYVDGRTSRWRVESFYKRVLSMPKPPKPLSKKPTRDEVAHSIVDEILNEEFYKEQKRLKELGLPHERRYRFYVCHKEEATHVFIYAVGGTTVPFDKVKKVGTVDWPPERIEEIKESARRHASQPYPNYSYEEWE